MLAAVAGAVAGHRLEQALQVGQAMAAAAGGGRMQWVMVLTMAAGGESVAQAAAVSPLAVAAAVAAVARALMELQQLAVLVEVAASVLGGKGHKRQPQQPA